MVYGEDADPEVLSRAKEIGAIDQPGLLRSAEVTFVATPVGSVAAEVSRALAETEGLVIRVLDLWKQRGAVAGPRIVDVGTGSGAIGVTLATRLPGATVLATDRSKAAVAVATANAQRHGVADRVELAVGDLLDHPAAAGPWDFIVSNPPYVREDEFEGLPPDVRLHEPREALVAGPTGCELIARLLPQAAERLAPGGWLLIEVGPATAAMAEQLVAETAGLIAEPTLPDAAGLPRIIQARRAKAAGD